jgi:hypothetical protein
VKCPDTQASIAALQAGRLGLTEWAELEAHARACEACDRALDLHYRSLPRDRSQRSRPPAPGTRRWHWRIGAAVAGGALAVALGGYAYQHRDHAWISGFRGAGPAPAGERESPPPAPEVAPPVVSSSPARADQPPPALPKPMPKPPASSPPGTAIAPARTEPSKMASRGSVAPHPGLEPSSRESDERTPNSSGMPAAPADVIVQISVQDRKDAQRDLDVLAARVGGSRLVGDSPGSLKLMVPRSRYGEFTRGLARIGSWQVEEGRRSLPDPVQVSVRLTRS